MFLIVINIFTLFTKYMDKFGVLPVKITISTGSDFTFVVYTDKVPSTTIFLGSWLTDKGRWPSCRRKKNCPSSVKMPNNMTVAGRLQCLYE